MTRKDNKKNIMNICMLAYTFYLHDNRVRRYAESLVKRGDNVDVISLKLPGQPEFEKVRGVNVYRIQKREITEKGKLDYLIRNLKFFIRTAIFLSIKQFKKRYDLIHVHSIPDFLVFSAIVPKLFGAKLILDIHDIVPEFFASKFNTSHRSLLYKLLIIAEKLSTAFSDHVIIANDIWHNKIISRSVNQEKCTAILNYPDDTIFYQRNSNSHDSRKIIFLYPGTLNWHQGLDIAIQALAKVKQLHPNFEFHIYGSGEKKDELKELSRRLGLESNILFKNGVPLQDLPDVISHADIGLIPKRNDKFGGEAFSTKSLEFMAVGLPVIISKTKIDQYYFNDDIVQFFEPGSSEDLADKIEKLIHNRKLRERLATNALRFSRDHNWTAKQSLYFNIVNSLVQ